MVIPRSRGALSGVLLIILGLFGALVALVGPYFDFVIGVDKAWNFGEGHLWLSVVPGVVAAIGGVILLFSANRATAILGAWVGLLAGIWFVVGEQVSQLWHNGQGIAGPALGGTTKRVVEHLAFYDGVGALIITFAAIALGRLTLRSVRDVELAREAELARAGDDEVADRPRRTRESGRFDRERTAAPAVGGAAAADGAVRAGERDEAAPAERPATSGEDRTTVAPAAGGDAPTETAPPRAGAGPTSATQTDTMTAAERVREMSGRDSGGATRVARRRGGLLGRFSR